MNIIGPPKDYLFIITSAIHATRGVFSSQERMDQTLLTIQSIKEKAPGSQIIIVDSSVRTLSDEDTALLQSKGIRALIKFDDNSPIVELSRQNRNSAGEIQSLMSVFSVLKTHKELQQVLSSTKRIFKISGRYQLNSNFNIKNYTNYEHDVLFGRYVFKELPTWMSPARVDASSLYITRLWSLCPSLLDDFMSKGQNIFNSVMREGLDLEHAMWKWLYPGTHVYRFMQLGCSGYIATNKELIHD